MNPTIELIMQRRSIRSYSDKVITDDEKSAIISATLRAPTAGNLMFYSILEIESKEIKEKLSETCDHQPFIARAPWVLIYLADLQRQVDYFEYCQVPEMCTAREIQYRTPKAGDLMLACCDALIAAQTTVLAAEALGLGSCYIGDIMENYEIHRDLLQLPRYVFPIAMLCIGHPARELSEKTRTRRFDKEFIVFKDAYRRLNAEDFKRMYDAEESTAEHPRQFFQDAENYGQAIFLRKISAAFSLEMVRSVNAMLKNWQ